MKIKSEKLTLLDYEYRQGWSDGYNQRPYPGGIEAAYQSESAYACGWRVGYHVRESVV